MANVAVIGAQWGDEGKGKVVDWLASRADIVVRFQGGHNAGHTLVVGNETYKLSLLPSGLVRGKLGIIGNGVVIDPEALLAEIERVRAQGSWFHPPTLRIAENAVLILPLHPAIDRAREAARGERKIGTTGRGIGPAYEDKVARRAIRVADLAEPETVADKLDELLLHHNTLLQGLGAETFSKEDLLARLLALAPRILPYAEPVWERLDEARRAGTAHPVRGCPGGDAGRRSRHLSVRDVEQHGGGDRCVRLRAWAHRRWGSCWASPRPTRTRVGSGPFPTELNDATGQLLGDRGKEFGTVTGRPRRCGWFDAVLVRQAVKVGGIHGLALDQARRAGRVARAAHLHRLPYPRRALPPSARRRRGAQAAAEPEYEMMEGWTGSTRGARSWADLPAQAVKYVRRIEELVEAPVTLLTTSPERDDTIMVKDPFEG